MPIAKRQTNKKPKLADLGGQGRRTLANIVAENLANTRQQG
ncbi:hypothetical protein [Moraxella bovis]|nr:hypothetical protein [Moraxella bovis]